MRKAARFAVIVVGATAIAFAMLWVVSGSGVAAARTGGTSSGLSNREAFVGLLTLGVLSLALFGFDLRDWF
jgi:hypothetical protein